MPSLALYGAVYSTCTQRVLIVLNELGLSYEMKNVDLMKGAHKDPSYIAHKHPFARVPVLEDGDLTIFESRAICRYLLSKYAGDGNELRLPQDPSALAVFEQTASVEYSYFSPAITDIAYEKLFKSAMGHGDTDAALVQKLEKNLLDCFDYYDSLLSGQKFLGGETCSLIDLLHVPWIAMLPRVGLEDALSTRHNLQSWWNKLRTRASWHSVEQALGH